MSDYRRSGPPSPRALIGSLSRTTPTTDPRVSRIRRELLAIVCARMDYLPHPGQIPLHVADERFRSCVKGRRGGGTTAAVAEIVAEAGIWSETDYADIGIFAQNARKTDIIWSRIWKWLVDRAIYGPDSIITKRNAPGNRLIELAWGARIFAFSLGEEGPGEGYGYRLAAFDESQLIQYSTWQESVRPALAELTGRGLFVGKAKGIAFRRLAEMAQSAPELWSTHRFPSYANPIFDKAEADQARDEMPGWLYLQEFEAQFTDAGVGLFDREMVYRCVRHDLEPRAEKEPGHSYVDGWDLARKHDETVGITLDRTTEPFVMVDWDGRFREPWPAQAKRIQARHEKWDAHVVFDATGVGDAVGQFLHIPESRLTEFIFSNPKKVALLTNLQGGIENQKVALPNEPRLLDQLTNYDWDDEDLETDWVMALALAYWGATAGKAPEARVRWLGGD